MADLAVGDVFRTRHPLGFRPLVEVTAIRDDVIEAVLMGTERPLSFSRITGEAIGDKPEDESTVIESVVLLAPAVVQQLAERDRRVQAWAAEQKERGFDSQFTPTEADKAAVAEAEATFDANPLNPQPPEAVGVLTAQVLDTGAPLAARARAARALGRYEYPEVVAILVDIASSPESPDSLVESAATGLAGLWYSRDGVDEAVKNRLLPAAMADIRRRIPWLDVGFSRLWCCRSCGFDTRDEYYWVEDDIWQQVAAATDHFLCIGCVENRLGRMLSANDFPDVPMNTRPGWHRTERLKDRLAR
ncbi:hypothetical protein ACFWU5_03015 [Nocardia sp. NPDC058640]|uniref:hypothetical protein n=1 Tax=Nocardia sp. NPDC058640 TaxID=3346571 RepID=UPI00365A647F